MLNQQREIEKTQFNEQNDQINQLIKQKQFTQQELTEALSKVNSLQNEL